MFEQRTWEKCLGVGGGLPERQGVENLVVQEAPFGSTFHAIVAVGFEVGAGHCASAGSSWPRF